MAVNFLDNLDLNGNQLLNVRLQNLASDPQSADAGDIIYNTTSNVFKYYNGTAWVDPSTGSYTKWVATGGNSGSSVDVNDGDTYKPAESTTRPGVIAEAVAKSGTVITQELGLFTKNMATSAPSAFSTAVLLWGKDSSATDWKVNKTHIDDIPVSAFGDATTTVDMGGFRILDVADPSNAQDAATKAYVDSNAGTTYTLPVTGTTNGVDLKLTDSSSTVASTVGIIGTSNEVTVSNLAAGNVTIGLPDDVTVAGELTVSGTGQSSFGGQVTVPATPSAGTDAASKSYVDTSTTAALIFQGGYDAANNTPDLDSNPSSSIKKGWAYVVTAAGDFFTEKVEVGDFLFAEVDAPTSLADWVTVQNNIGLATSTTVGIGNVVKSTVVNGRGLSVDYNAGTATIGLDIKNATVLPDPVGATDRLILWDGVNQGNYYITTASLKTYIEDNPTREFVGTTSNKTTHTFTHNLDTFNVSVELYDTSSKETVYATLDRTSVDVVTATTASSASLTALITKVG